MVLKASLATILFVVPRSVCVCGGVSRNQPEDPSLSLQRVVGTLGLVTHSTLSESEGPGVTSPHFCSAVGGPLSRNPSRMGLRCGSIMASWCSGWRVGWWTKTRAVGGAGPSILGGLCEWPQHAEPPLSRGAGHRGVVGQCGGPRVTRPACLAWVGCRGPRRPTAALSAQLVFGKAPAGVQDGGERVGSQALCTRSSSSSSSRLYSSQGGGEHQCRGLPASRLPPLLPVTQRPPAGRRLRFAAISSDPGSCRKWLPKRRQSPRCPGRGARSSPAPCSPSPSGDSPLQALTLAGSGAWGRGGGGGAATCRRGLTGLGVTGDSTGRTLSESPPLPPHHVQCPHEVAVPGWGNVNGALT